MASENTCLICMDAQSMVTAKLLKSKHECLHPVCHGCLVTYVRVNLRERRPVECPKCSKTMPLAYIRYAVRGGRRVKLLSSVWYACPHPWLLDADASPCGVSNSGLDELRPAERWRYTLICEAAPGTWYCPTPGCSYLTRLADEPLPRAVRCYDCCKSYCRICSHESETGHATQEICDSEV